MAQVKTPDTAYLMARDPDQHASLVIGAVAIVGGTAPDHDALRDAVSQRLRSIPRCTQLLSSDQEWINCPGFDLSDHVHRVAVPRPGDDTDLSRAIARALERPLDADRPPWECWVIEGLKGGRWALLVKAHQGLASGNPAAHLLARLCDDADSNTFANHSVVKPDSSPQRAKPGWADPLGRAAALAGGLAGAALAPVRFFSIDPVTTLRGYRTVRVRIADVDSVCRKFGVTANDVAVAAITEGFRTVLLASGEQPRSDSLRTLVPMPVESTMLPYLPVDHDDPLQRLRAVRSSWQAELSGRPAGVVESAITRLPNRLRTSVVQLLSLLPQRRLVTLATTVPGPRRRLRLMGQTIERLLPVPPTAAQLSTGVAVLSYGDELVFGVAGSDAGFDVKQLAAGIELGMARLVALSDDSVLLFNDRGRKRSRALPGHPRGPHPFAPGQARH